MDLGQVLMFNGLQLGSLGQVGRHSILIFNEGLSMVEYVLVRGVLQAVDLEFAVVGVFCCLEEVDFLEEVGLFVCREGVAHGSGGI
jgi:hypothetical protein